MQDFCQVPWNILLVCNKSFLNGWEFSPANLRWKTIWPNRGKTPQKTVWFLGFFSGKTAITFALFQGEKCSILVQNCCIQIKIGSVCPIFLGGIPLWHL